MKWPSRVRTAAVTASLALRAEAGSPSRTYDITVYAICAK